MSLRVRTGLKVQQPVWLRIGDWLVKPNENTLCNQTSRQSLEPKLMNLLLWLAQHANEVQSNEVLLQQVWGGTFYSDNPLHRSIAVLRRALGDSAANPRFIRTVRKRGYQLIANVSFPDNAQMPLYALAHLQHRCASPSLESFAAPDTPVPYGRKNTLAALAGVLQQLLEHQAQPGHAQSEQAQSGVRSALIFVIDQIELLARRTRVDGAHDRR